LHVVDAHELLERQAFDAQVVLGGDFLGHNQVKTGLGFTRIGDGAGAHFEVAFGRGQLFGHRLFLRLNHAHAVAGR